MATSLKTIQSLIDEGRKKEAQQALKPLLKSDPSAQAWYLAALLVNDNEQKIKCLRRALAIDALHTPSNRLLHQLDDTPMKPVQPMPVSQEPVGKLPGQDEKLERAQEQKRSHRRRRGFGCLVSFTLSIIICTVILSLAGMIPGTIGLVLQMSTGSTPVREINGTPIESVADPIMQIAPSVSRSLSARDYFAIDHGYVHEYTFPVSENQVYGVYVIFFSFNTANLADNIAILDGNGNRVTNCQDQGIPDNNNVVGYACLANQNEQWSVRVIGIQGETVGGYIIGHETVE